MKFLDRKLQVAYKSRHVSVGECRIRFLGHFPSPGGLISSARILKQWPSCSGASDDKSTLEFAGSVVRDSRVVNRRIHSLRLERHGFRSGTERN